MTYNTTDSVLRRHYDQHLSVGGAEIAGTAEEGMRMAGVAATNVGGAAAGAAGGAVAAAGAVAGRAGNAVNDTRHAAGNAQGNAAYDSTGTSANVNTKSGSGPFGFLKLLIPAAIVGLLAWAGMKFMGKTPDVDMPTAEMPKVEMPSMEMPEIPGLPDGMGAELGDSFSGAASALGGITDVDSAKAALPALDGLTGMLDKVPEGARGSLGGMIGNLTPMIDKASALPGVGDVLGPVAEKLQGFM